MYCCQTSRVSHGATFQINSYSICFWNASSSSPWRAGLQINLLLWLEFLVFWLALNLLRSSSVKGLLRTSKFLTKAYLVKVYWLLFERKNSLIPLLAPIRGPVKKQSTASYVNKPEAIRKALQSMINIHLCWFASSKEWGMFSQYLDPRGY